MTVASIVLGVSLLWQGMARAEDWRKTYPEITLGVITSENEADRLVRYKPVRAYLERALGVNQMADSH